MRVLTLAGTRPELVRLSLLIARLDAAVEHRFVYTGQNHDRELRDIFFEELSIRAPDADLAMAGGSLGQRLGKLFDGVERELAHSRPDRLLVLGDTDSALATIVAARAGVPVFHMEAGNRCFDRRVPEEVNRRLVDHASTVLMPYTERSARHLTDEGIARRRIVVTGNPIAEVIDHHDERIRASDVRARLGLDAGSFGLMTLHRAETVDDPGHLIGVLDGVERSAKAHGLRIVFPIHPRTTARLRACGRDLDPDVFVASAPIGFFDFVALERSAAIVFTDSGTVQEECVIARVPHVIVRDSTERPEAIECGAGIIAGRTTDGIVRSAEVACATPTTWPLPMGYEPGPVAQRVVASLLGALPIGFSA
jgi:UDP-N-acetylglucosamine 2-epimerase (non-hydrolysing)